VDLQSRILISYAVLAAAVLAVFVVVAVHSRGPVLPQATVQSRGYAIRRWWFLLLAAVLAVAFAVSIPFFPYGKAQAASEPAHVGIVARQFSFDQLPAVIPVGSHVVFDVTAADVNHGFAVYDPHEQLIGQVQAMPGYVNHLEMTFDEPGQYTVRCLEYCGLGHPVMQGKFEVR
jgi:cytochrome c oxidase subunit 2